MPVSVSGSPHRTVAHKHVQDQQPLIARIRRRLGPPPGKATYRDGAIRHWLDTFHHLHTDGLPYIPVALRLDAASGSHAASSTERYLYEVALHNDARGERWVLIMWEVDVPGVHFCDCTDRAEAMALFAHPAQAAGRWQGVRLRPESRPW